MIKRILKCSINVITVFCIVIILFTLFQQISSMTNLGHVPSLFGYKFISVTTDNMMHTINPGDMILVREINPDDIKIEDTMIYDMNESIFAIPTGDGIIGEIEQSSFGMAAYSNNADGTMPPLNSELLGVLLLRIPYAGYIQQFAGSIEGFFILYLIPVAYLAVKEIKGSMYKEFSNNKSIQVPNDSLKAKG